MQPQDSRQLKRHSSDMVDNWPHVMPAFSIPPLSNITMIFNITLDYELNWLAIRLLFDVGDENGHVL